MNGALLSVSLAAVLGAGAVWAAPFDAPPPPPPPNDQPDRPPGPGPGPGPDHDHHRPPQGGGGRQPGFFPHMGGDHGDIFRHLSEEDRQKVRRAFEKAWSKPEVLEARNQLMKATDQYREALHQAIEEADPEVTKILERNKDDGPPGGRPRSSPQPMPEPNDPEFTRKAVLRLAGELQGWMGLPDHGDHRDSDRRRDGERRESLSQRLHERIVQVPAVQDAIKELSSKNEPSQRMEEWKHLREVYINTARSEIAKMREGQRPEPPPAPPEKKSSAPPQASDDKSAQDKAAPPVEAKP